jgi:subtilase family serine protease
VDLVPVTNYRLAFLGETASTVNLPTVIVDGPDPGINGDEVETFLDMEVLGGLVPKAKINYYTSDSSDLSAGIFNAMQRAINDNQVSILSISFGECEAGNGTATNQFIAEIYEQAAAQGITVSVSSGDSGAAGCDPAGISSATQGLAVNGLGSTPYNISVGGTDYVALASSFPLTRFQRTAVPLRTGAQPLAIFPSAPGTTQLPPMPRSPTTVLFLTAA